MAQDYRWTEEQFEIDLVVKVPENTRGKDLTFKASPTGVDLRLRTVSDGEVVLLDGSRAMRGKLHMDGTFWRIEDAVDDNDEDNSGPYREVVVTLEKYRLPTGQAAAGVGDVNEALSPVAGEEYDWGGVYPNDDDEVTTRVYDVAEELDVREYAKTLGVDVDRLNMSMVDKSMFSVMNVTQDALEDLQTGGFVKEVTRQQDDGREFGQRGDGSVGPFRSPYGDMVDTDDLTFDKKKGRVKIPFIDDDNELVPQSTPQPSSQSPIQHEPVKEEQIIAKVVNNDDDNTAITNDILEDPIDKLTVVRLKDILREQKLKVSGTKQELRDRLRAHVEAKIEDSFGTQ